MSVSYYTMIIMIIKSYIIIYLMLGESLGMELRPRILMSQLTVHFLHLVTQNNGSYEMKIVMLCCFVIIFSAFLLAYVVFDL